MGCAMIDEGPDTVVVSGPYSLLRFWWRQELVNLDGQHDDRFRIVNFGQMGYLDGLVKGQQPLIEVHVVAQTKTRV